MVHHYSVLLRKQTRPTEQLWIFNFLERYQVTLYHIFCGNLHWLSSNGFTQLAESFKTETPTRCAICQWFLFCCFFYAKDKIQLFWSYISSSRTCVLSRFHHSHHFPLFTSTLSRNPYNGLKQLIILYFFPLEITVEVYFKCIDRCF